MVEQEKLQSYLACPRCDKAPLSYDDGAFRCDACKIDFPDIDGIPWMFADPDASLGEWRNRLQFALQQLGHEVAGLEVELKDKDLRALTRRRIERYRKSAEQHRRALQKLLRPVDVQSQSGSYESYLALRTRLPVDQGLNTYYANIHRDWVWGEEENEASLKQVRSVLHDHVELGDVLVLGAGAGRLAYDIHKELDCSRLIAMDFNPLLMLVAKQMADGNRLSMYEFPIAPKSLEDDAVLRKLSAPEPAGEDFHLVLGDALRAPFAAGSFDAVVTPWLIDIITEDLARWRSRIRAARGVTARKKPRRSLPSPGSRIPMFPRRPFRICVHRQAVTAGRNGCFRFAHTRSAMPDRCPGTRPCPTGSSPARSRYR
jgi:uncharacterized protein YbaR (Trm112 family)